MSRWHCAWQALRLHWVPAVATWEMMLERNSLMGRSDPGEGRSFVWIHEWSPLHLRMWIPMWSNAHPPIFTWPSYHAPF